MVPCMKYCQCPSLPRSKWTKDPHDTVHIPLVASGSGSATPSPSPVWNQSLHQGASAHGHSEERTDDASVGCDLHFASHSWLSACSWLAKQISGSDLWPAASVLMRTSGISHIIQTSSPLPRKGQIVSIGHWPTMKKPQSFAFIRSGAVEVPRMNVRGTTALSYSLAWRGRDMSKINTGDFLPLLLPLTFFMQPESSWKTGL